MQNDFEKSVRDKMEELKFVPTAPVWTGIEAQIRRKKDRRWLIIWLPLLCLLLAGGILWINQGSRQQSKDSAQGNPLSSSTHAIQKQSSLHPVNTNHESEDKTSGSGIPGIKKENILIDEEVATLNQPVVKKADNYTGAGNPGARAVKNPARKLSNQGKPQTEFNRVPVANHDIPAPAIENQSPIQQEMQAEKKILVAKAEEDTVAKKEEVLTTDSAATSEPLKNKLKTGQKWKVAVVAQAGQSGLGEGLNFGAQKEAMDPLTSNPNTPFTNADHGMAPRKEGLSFSAGIALSREIRSRLHFSAGLQYNYYSYTLNIGEDSLGISTGIRYYFSASQNESREYKNNFHFISLPVALEWQMFKRVPLNVQAGLSLQQLISSHALVYNAQNSAYVSDKKALNHTQLFSQLGLNYGFKLKKALTLQLGPQLQYGLTKMEKNNGNRHLYQAGLNARIIF